MLNKHERDNKMDKTILVVECQDYSWGKSYSIKKHAKTLDEAVKYKLSLENLNDSNSITYELFNALGQFQVEEIKKVESEVTNEVRQ